MIESLIGATSLTLDSLVKEVADLKYSLQYHRKILTAKGNARQEHHCDLVN